MPSNLITLEHIIEGGWSTNFGIRTNVRMNPNEGTIRLPFVTQADDMFWELDNGWRKVGGTARLGAQQESGATVTGVFDYWRHGTAGSPAQRKIAHVGTKVKHDGGNDTWTDLFTGLEADAVPSYMQFQDLLIISSTSTADVPKKWDQSTAADLGGSPPNFAFAVEHKNRVFASGDVANPSRVYYSELEDAEIWSGGTSGHIDVALGDGDAVTGLISYKDELWVFKGPYKGSIHRISGSNNTDFARRPFLTGKAGLPCVAHNTIFEFNDDVGFMTPSGTIHTLKSTAAFGDYHQSSLTREITEYIRTNVNSAAIHKACTQTDQDNGRIYIAFATGSSLVNNVVLVYDYNFQLYDKPNRWSRILSWPVHSLGSYTDGLSQKIMAGGADGFIRECDTNEKNIDGISAIAKIVKTPFIAYTNSFQKKTHMNAGISLTPHGSHTLDYSWKRDKNAPQTETISQGATGGLFDTAQWDIDVFADTSFSERFCEIQHGGSFRWIQHTFTQNTLNEDAEVHGFTTQINLDDAGTA